MDFNCNHDNFKKRDAIFMILTYVSIFKVVRGERKYLVQESLKGCEGVCFISLLLG